MSDNGSSAGGSSAAGSSAAGSKSSAGGGSKSGSAIKSAVISSSKSAAGMSSKSGASSSKASSLTASKASRSSTGGRRKGKGTQEVDLSTAKIGFLGAGKVTESIVTGLINVAKVDPNRIYIAAPTTKNSAKFKEKGCHVTKRNIDLFARYDCNIIFLACHGAVVAQCYKMGGTRPHPLTVNFIPNMKHPLIVLSCVSGFDCNQIKKVLLNPEHPHKYMLEMHRVVINSASSYGVGIACVDVDPDSNKLSGAARTLLTQIATLEHVVESQQDAACAVTGAGLAFCYYFIQALSDGAFKMGLKRNMAVKFAAKTVACAAQSQLESGRHPGELRDAVCAPKGPAIYGLHVLDKAEVASGITAAVEGAYKRSQELAGK